MSDAFVYRPKFVDIRVKRDAAHARVPSDEQEAGQRRCDHVGCERAGVHRAPKGREHGNQYWHFCLEHASDYNKRWNYFSGMSDMEVNAFMAREEVGQRPTWTFRSGRLDRASSPFRGGRRGDPFNLFGNAGGEAAAAPRRRLSRLQSKALEEMSLPETADGAQIRARYAELVKRWHPDSNGGDRTAEASLHRVIAAYQTLKAAGLV
jgi:hypothetical protein